MQLVAVCRGPCQPPVAPSLIVPGAGWSHSPILQVHRDRRDLVRQVAVVEEEIRDGGEAVQHGRAGKEQEGVEQRPLRRLGCRGPVGDPYGVLSHAISTVRTRTA